MPQNLNNASKKFSSFRQKKAAAVEDDDANVSSFNTIESKDLHDINTSIHVPMSDTSFKDANGTHTRKQSIFRAAKKLNIMKP